MLKKEGFDPRLSSILGMFGDGFYLAENSSKSNQYIPCVGCGRNAVFHAEKCECTAELQDEHVYKMLVYRAVLADCHICINYTEVKYRGIVKQDRVKKGMFSSQQMVPIDCLRKIVRRPPLKEGLNIPYDSVLGESKRNGGDTLEYREVVLYEPMQAYPEYEIHYRRALT